MKIWDYISTKVRIYSLHSSRTSAWGLRRGAVKLPVSRDKPDHLTSAACILVKVVLEKSPGSMEGQADIKNRRIAGRPGPIIWLAGDTHLQTKSP